MPLPDGLLNPIPGANPGGENLRYAPIYDKIKEARRSEEELPQGDWTYEIKKADYAAVFKLATAALATKSKDLQLAAWLTEALLAREGFVGLKEGLSLMQRLIEQFWDTLYPELEDGEAGLRAAPVEWVGSFLDEAVRRIPLTRSGFDWFKYKESRAVGSEQDCAGNEAKLNARQTAIAEGKLTPEEFEEDFKATGKEFYEQLAQGVDGALEALQALDELGNQKFGREAPSFGRLRDALEELQHAARGFLKKKKELEPEPEAAAAVEEVAPGPGGAAAAAAPARKKVVAEEPADREDAFRRVVAVARYLRREEPNNPVPYLLLRGLRWGELRAAGANPDPTWLEAPPTEIRQQLKRLSLEGQWGDLLESAENAMGMPCGRAWLDLQRYAVKACEELGSDYEPIAMAVRSELRALLGDFSELSQWSLADDTPTSNPETQAWLQEGINPPLPPPADPEMPTAPAMEAEEPAPASESSQPDAQVLALQAAKSGRIAEAIEILTREIAQERSGRARFQRKIQLASLCLAAKHVEIAYPILEELAHEIERRKLDEWEASDTVAQPLALLFRCLEKLERNAEEKQRVYERLCRLDPVQALACLK